MHHISMKAIQHNHSSFFVSQLKTPPHKIQQVMFILEGCYLLHELYVIIEICNEHCNANLICTIIVDSNTPSILY